MAWVVLTIVLLVIGFALVRWCLPPPYRYLSPRKRRAMRLALRAFEQTPNARANWPGCRVCHTDAEKCLVVIQRRQPNPLGLPGRAGYIVRHDSDHAEELAGETVDRGGLPRHTLDELARRLTKGETARG